MLVWKELKLIRHFFQTLEAVAWRCSVSKGVLRKFARYATVLKKRRWHRCFSVNFAKFLRATFLQNTSSGCSCLHITINSSLSSVLFDSVDILIFRNIKNLSKFCFLLCNIPTFDVYFWYIFEKTCSNLASECEISGNNRKKLDESWTRSTFLQLNGWGKNCQVF